MNLPKNEYSVIIVDDDLVLCNKLWAYFDEHRTTFNVLQQCHDYDCALEALKKEKPDLVLLDIELGTRDSFDLIKELDEINFEIIFITNGDEHALKALQFSAIDYLVKPFSIADLNKAITKAKDKIKNNNDLNRYDILRHNIFRSQKSHHKIIIPESSSFEFVTTRDILRCEGWSKYTKVFLVDGRMITSSYNLGHYRKILETYSFFHCHKSHLINTTHIKSYLNIGTVEMNDGTMIPVARRKKELFVKMVIKENFFFQVDNSNYNYDEAQSYI